ncbi:MAG: DUF2147 domain-containing protein [Flavobacteriaceae bacterium]|nr:DUF2147 domain-containing protein [Flavobacteriaceae bacterium]
MKHLFSTICALLIIGTLSAQDIFGKWKTIDDETGKEKSIVEIYQENGKVYAKILQLLDKDKQDAICENCEDNDPRKNQPVKGMVIIDGLKKDGNEYSGATILDPKKGKIYKCKIWLDEENPNKLNVRGYIAFFFRTQNWFRATE